MWHDKWFHEPNFTGCTFTAAAAEFHGADNAILRIVIKQKKYLTNQISEVLTPLIGHISFVHLTLLRLPVHIVGILFTRAGSEGTYFRSYQPITDEIEQLKSRPSLDGLCALVGLVFEAASIRDMVRLRFAKKALRESVGIIGEIIECQRFNYLLMQMIDRNCLRTSNPKYFLRLHHGFGLPMSWRAGAGASLLEEIEVERT
ncbi:hypothetical protein [Collimonas arenae]|uniref:hypothetical protein n=1 Tax=Collimonas arenae TaxID=279058 RepID=UPI00056F7891|nr:hypothetical protein [Collimonas arenae]